MPEPSAREALLSLAAVLDFKSTTEHRGDHAVSVWGEAAEIARNHLAALAAVAREPETGTGEGADPGRLTGDLRAAALDAVLEILDLDTWERWLGGHGEVRSLVSKMLAAAEPFIRSSEREQCVVLLRRAAAGRSEYADRGTDRIDDVEVILRRSAKGYEDAASLLEKPRRVMDIIPSWRWTETERADLMREQP